MKRIVTIVGARPQFIKAAPVSRALRRKHREVLVHTGQHYDRNMSQLFFEEMQIPRPDLNLDVRSGPHGWQTGQMLIKIEEVLTTESPDFVLVYGDTNSTLAGALAAAKLHIPVAHVEAGLRSFNRQMPEEINRICTDRISDLLFCPTRTAVRHLKAEGITTGVHLTGDVMLDAAHFFSALADEKSDILTSLELDPKQYILVTCHRAHNTDDRNRLGGIVDALIQSGSRVVFPLHPRTRHYLKQYDLLHRLENTATVRLIEPAGYLDMISLEKNATKIVTDSGGVQKEAYFYRIPCVTLRDETEWVETVEDGWNVLVGSDPDRIRTAIQTFDPPLKQSDHYGDGHASERIVEQM